MYKKLTNLLFFSCFLCSVYSAPKSKSKKNKVHSVSEIVLQKKLFVQGKGAFWELQQCNAFVDSGKNLKDAFRTLIQRIKDQNISIPEEKNSVFSSKNNGESYRLKIPFCMDDFRDLRYFFEKCMRDITDKTELNLGLISDCLEKFHTETNSLLKHLKVLSEEYLVPMLENDTSSETDFKQTYNIIDVKTSLPQNIGLELRLVGGKVRNLEPHEDGNTVCVFSLDTQGVYEFVESTKEKKFLENQKSYLWFGNKCTVFPKAVYTELSKLGVEQESITPLIHGVECKNEKDPISLLLIVKNAQNNRVCIAVPKTEENFQAFLTPKNDTLRKTQDVEK